MVKSKFEDVLPQLYIRISNYHDFCWSGEIHNPLLGYKKEFSGLINFIEIILEYLDHHKLVLPPSLMRSWSDENENIERADYNIITNRNHNKHIQEEVRKIMEIKFKNYKDKLGTTDFLIKICFRQHTSWQGEIQWIISDSKESKTIFFRSLLEMIFLMQEALEKDNKVKADFSFNSWDDNKIELDSYGDETEEDT
jgi:hypothetical protein